MATPRITPHSQTRQEPVRGEQHPPAPQQQTAPQPVPQNTPPHDVTDLLERVRAEFPQQQIRLGQRFRPPRRQAELMANSRRANRAVFLGTYISQPHVLEMDQWAAAHPHATQAETYSAFEEIVNRAIARGATVSNHQRGNAQDMSIPLGAPADRERVRQRIEQLGGSVIIERDAAGGPHWHVDYRSR